MAWYAHPGRYIQFWVKQHRGHEAQVLVAALIEAVERGVPRSEA
jgi:hypothetical protein